MLSSRRSRITKLALAAVLLLGCEGAALDEGTELQRALDGVNLNATIQLTSSWSSGYCATLNIKNLGSVAVSTWTAVIDLNQATMSSSWNANVTGSGSRKTITPFGLNAPVNPGATVSVFGYCATITGFNSSPIVISPTSAPVRDASAGPDVARDSARSPDVAKDSARSPDVAKDSARSPDVAKDSARSPDVAKDSARSPDVAK
jgi:hypothetical protein